MFMWSQKSETHCSAFKLDDSQTLCVYMLAVMDHGGGGSQLQSWGAMLQIFPQVFLFPPEQETSNMNPWKLS